MDRTHSVSSLRRASEASSRLKTGLITDAPAWDIATASRRPQLAQLASGSLSAPKKLQQQDVSHNQLPTASLSQSLRRLSSGIRLNRSTPKRVTKVPRLTFNQLSGRRRGRLSNQFGDAETGTRQVNAGVYLLENVKTGHRYFGTTWDLENAAAQSFHDLQLAVHPHPALSMCFKLYGEAASGIRFRVLEHVKPPSSPKPPSSDQIRAKRRQVKRLRAGREAHNNDDGFDVRAMERKLAARLRYHQQKVVRRVAYKFIRRVLVMPVLARVWTRWIHAIEDDVLSERIAATVEIQRVVRGYFDRLEVSRRRRDGAARTLQKFMRHSQFSVAYRRRARSLCESTAACVIQRSLREFTARRRAQRRRAGVRRWFAARKLQTQVRRHLARRVVDGMRQDTLRTRAATDIQRTTRGYLTRRRVQRLRQRLVDVKAAKLIQKTWRGYWTHIQVTLQRATLSTQVRLEELRDEVARTIQQAYSRWRAQCVREQKEKATTICMAYRNYVGRKFGWAALTIRVETSMATRIQRAGRRWILRRVIALFKRDKAARTIQCLTRQHQARRQVHALRVKKRRVETIRKIQAYSRACWSLRKLRARLQTRRRQWAARRIQTSFRAWRARRAYVVIRDRARRNRAATTLQCLFRARQARRERRRRQVILRLGACESCRSQLATMYHFEAQSQLCADCSAEYASFDDAGTETLDVNVYRRLRVPLVKAQRTYRAFQYRMQLQFGTCTLCEKLAVRRSCWSCLPGHGCHDGNPIVGLTFCRSCDALFHEQKKFTGASNLLQHQRKDIERVYAEAAAALTIQTCYRRFLQRQTLADLRFARQTAAATRVQECYRRHRQRRITRATCAAHRQQQLLEASAVLTIQRAVRGHLARCELRRLQHERDCAIRIQRARRRHQAKRVYNAAVVIQCNVRGWLARGVADTLRQRRLENQRKAAACGIQRHVRGFLARRRVLHIRQHNAAVLLQRRWRGYAARCELHGLKRDKQHTFNEELRERLSVLAAQTVASERAAARQIQTMERARQARTELRRRKLQAARRARELLRDRAVALEVASATCIQRHVRERLTTPTSRQRLGVHRCARCFLSRRTVKRIRLEKRSAVRIQCAFRYARAKRRLARLVDADAASSDDIAASAWVELFDETSGYVYYYQTETGQSVWERPPEMDASAGSPQDADSEDVGEWVEYWDENVGASYFYNIITGEATWTTPAGYQSSNQEAISTAGPWPLENGTIYSTLPSRSKLEPLTETEKQQIETYGDQDGGSQAVQSGSDACEQYELMDTEYDINYKIYLTQVERERQEQEQ